MQITPEPSENGIADSVETTMPKSSQRSYRLTQSWRSATWRFSGANGCVSLSSRRRMSNSLNAFTLPRLFRLQRGRVCAAQYFRQCLCTHERGTFETHLLIEVIISLWTSGQSPSVSACFLCVIVFVFSCMLVFLCDNRITTITPTRFRNGGRW